MRTVAILAQKGGAGKTTLTLNLAVRAMLDGKAVAVVDLDPQASAAKWGDARDGDPAVVSAQHVRLGQVIDTAREAHCDWVFVDTAPHSEAVALAAARAADIILIPCRPAIFDLRSIQTTLEIAALAKTKAHLVLNAVPPQGSLGTEAQKAVRDSVTVAPYFLGQRVAYVHAATNNQGVNEYDPDGKAAREITNLYKWMTKL